MDFTKVIKEEQIDLNLKAINKEEVLQELTDLLVDVGLVSDKESFLNDVYKRESIGTTGIGNYIAIPHGKSKFVNRTAIAIGRVNNGIEWESLDGLPVKFIILFAVTEEDKTSTHIKLLSKVASTLGDDEVCKKLLEVDSKEEIIMIFSEDRD